MATRNIKTIVITKHVHSCFASCATGDAFLRIITTSKEIDFMLTVNKRITSKKFPGLNGELLKEKTGDSQFIALYLDSDETFCKKGPKGGMIGDSYKDTPEFKALVKSYFDKGFKIDKDIPEQNAFHKRERDKHNNKMKKRGVVLWGNYEDYSGHPEMYQGGFSDEVFNSKELKRYVSSGHVNGWIGHCGRTADNDRQIEAGLRKRGISPSEMYNWISSGSGRHFGDSIEGLTKKEQKEKIENNLNHMYNNCIIYATPTHEGTYGSTQRIAEGYEGLGVLLPLDKKYNHEEHMNNLFLAKKKLSNKKEMTPEETFINDMITQIFSNKL